MTTTHSVCSVCFSTHGFFGENGSWWVLIWWVGRWLGVCAGGRGADADVCGHSEVDVPGSVSTVPTCHRDWLIGRPPKSDEAAGLFITVPAWHLYKDNYSAKNKANCHSLGVFKLCKGNNFLLEKLSSECNQWVAVNLKQSDSST